MSRHPQYSKKGVSRARILRKRTTLAEQKLWRKLRNNQLGANFRRQAPLGPFIVDFLSIRARLIVELDGSQHLRPDRAERDKQRTTFLNRQGYRVVRFYDTEFLKNSPAVIQKIKELIEYARVVGI